MLRFFSASTSIVNSRKAITECLEVALEGEPNLDCDLIIIYTGVGHNFKEILSEAHKLCPNAHIVGCTCAGVIGREGPNEAMKALAIMVIKGSETEFAVAGCAESDPKDQFGHGVRLAEDLKHNAPDINMILFLPSVLPFSPKDQAIAGIESVFSPNTPIFGGMSVDNMKGVNTYAIFEDQVIEKGWVAVGLADPTLKIFTMANHGFSVLKGVSLDITRSEPGIIYEFNGQPAWKLMTNLLGVSETADPLEVMSLAILAQGLPEELAGEYGSSFILRSAVGNVKENSFYYPDTCNTGTRLFLAKRDEKSMFEGVDLMTKRILEILGGKKAEAVFHADCLLRGRFSINRILKDEIIHRMQTPLCQNELVPWLGFYSGGEFAMIRGKNWIHTFTTALAVIYR